MVKNQTIHTTTPCQNLHCCLVRRRPPPRKKTVSITGHFGFLMYFMRLRYHVKGSIAFLLSFYNRCRRDMRTVNVLLMLFLFSLHQKSPPLVPYPTTSVGSAVLTLTATSSLLSLKGLLMLPSFLPSSSLSLSIMKLTRQLFVETPCKSTKLPSHLINWLSIKDIRCELEKTQRTKDYG